jgi:AbrB family looped-hinge helix DNA binding protein
MNVAGISIGPLALPVVAFVPDGVGLPISSRGNLSAATVTSKGRITIPLAVRRSLGLDAGDRVEFVEIGHGEFAMKLAANDVRSLKGMIRKPARPASIRAISAAIRRRGAGHSSHSMLRP